MKLSTASVTGLLVLPFIATTANAAQFISFGAGTFAEGVSGDGSTAVGWGPRSSADALLWTSSGSTRNLGDLSGTVLSHAYASSWNGSVVVGVSFHPLPSEAFRWTENDGIRGLGVLSGYTHSSARDISADGSVVVGAVYGESNPSERPREAFRWTEGVGMVGLGALPGHTRSGASGVSADGLAVVGTSFGPDVGEAFRWTEAGGLEGLGFLPGSTHNDAVDISSDGATVVGSSATWVDDAWIREAFLWTEGVGIVGLGTLPGDTWGWASAISADGSVVVGYSEGGPGEENAFVWDETHGMRRVEDVLTAAGLDMTGWRLRFANGVSDDGNVIVGWGGNPSGGEEAWMAILSAVPEPGAITLAVASGLLGLIVPIHRHRRSKKGER